MIYKEISAFGAVGLLGFVVDIAVFNVLLDHGQVVAKCASTTVAMVITYLGNRYISFSHRAGAGSAVRRQVLIFVVVNAAALLMAVAALNIFKYTLGFHDDQLVMNAVNLAAIAAGTVLRFWAYRRFVFTSEGAVLAPLAAAVHATAATAK